MNDVTKLICLWPSFVSELSVVWRINAVIKLRIAVIYFMIRRDNLCPGCSYTSKTEENIVSNHILSNRALTIHTISETGKEWQQDKPSFLSYDSETKLQFVTSSRAKETQMSK